MKTTINISDPLFAKARRLAAQTGGSFKEIVEAALRLFLKSREETRQPFRLRKHCFKGRGLAKGLVEGDWAAIRQRAYEGHGG